jgi:hypothetical protein
MIVLVGWPSAMWLFGRLRNFRFSALREAMMVASFVAAAVLSVATWLLSMRSGVRALNDMNR